MRLAVYAGTSTLVAAGALVKAFHQRPNFYSATVYLSQSNACVLILTNLALVYACTLIYGLQRLFYGPLRQIEMEQLTEKAWYALLDTLFAMPSLSHDVSGWMLAAFVLLLTGKVWSWIGEGRVDILEQQPPQNPRAFHARLSSSLIVSILFNLGLLQYCIKTVRDDPRPGMMVIFTFEFAILSIFSLFTFSRYILALIEARILRQQTEAKIEERKAEIRAERERLQRDHAATGATQDLIDNLPVEDEIDENEIDVPGWEEKRRWLFGLELATDFTKLIIYTICFAISLTFMGLPMHIMRDVYLTFSAFAKRIQDYSNYRKATQNMNDRYSDATAQELSNDNTCIVCREAMLPWGQPEAADANTQRPARMNESLRAKKLPCGHILHLRCLKAWLERQQTCPTCRRPVIGPQAQNTAVPGQPRIEGPDAGLQHHNGGGNAQQAGNNAGPAPAQPAPRANRLRMLNLGPIRIGLYNGPAHQIQEALGQRQNPQPQQTQGGAGLGAGAGTGTGAGTTGHSTSALGTQSTQVQLMQVEERLMHDARTLAIEQTQFQTVRALEAELARLRGLHDRTQQGTPAIQAMANLPPQILPTGLMQMQLPTTMPFGAGIHLPQAFQPFPGQAPLNAGHPALPPGMALPEGWSVTPLRRIGATPQPEQPVNETQAPVTRENAAVSTPPVSVAVNEVTSPTSAALAHSAPAASAATAQPSQGFTSGSSVGQIQPQPTEPQANPIAPSQIPTTTASANSSHSPLSSQAASSSLSESSIASTSQMNEVPRPDLQAETAPTLVDGPGWTFGDLDRQPQESSNTVSDIVGDGETAANGAVDEVEKEEGKVESSAEKSRDKGKGRAVTVEDVQDAED